MGLDTCRRCKQDGIYKKFKRRSSPARARCSPKISPCSSPGRDPPNCSTPLPSVSPQHRPQSLPSNTTVAPPPPPTTAHPMPKMPLIVRTPQPPPKQARANPHRPQAVGQLTSTSSLLHNLAQCQTLITKAVAAGAQVPPPYPSTQFLTPPSSPTTQSLTPLPHHRPSSSPKQQTTSPPPPLNPSPSSSP